ncbi:MAG TPA: ABC transporter substrate-binding protein [Propionibacterium sp.]|jgi:osmoprotectant transport system substrate-binding protein|nr:ABC transporter substrate-binding protein [Propionibacterium sp.]
MKRRTLLLLGAAAAASVPLSACGANQNPLDSGATPDAQTGNGGGSSGPLVVGSANFTESMVIAELYAQAIRAKGVEVSTRHGIGSREVYLRALRDGSIQIVPEYGGNLLQYLDDENPAGTTEEIAQALGEVAGPDLAVLDPASAANQDVYCVTRAYSEEHGITSLADLPKIADDAILGGPAELKDRPYGPPGLEAIYRATFREFRTYDALAVKVRDLTSGTIQVATFFTTDSAIGENDLVMLEDPEVMILPQPVIPLLRADLKDDSAVAEAVNAVQAELQTEDLTAMNREVDVERRNPEEAAEAWLTEKGLV